MGSQPPEKWMEDHYLCLLYLFVLMSFCSESGSYPIAQAGRVLTNLEFSSPGSLSSTLPTSGFRVLAVQVLLLIFVPGFAAELVPGLSTQPPLSH